jgi:hypothetical protein
MELKNSKRKARSSSSFGEIFKRFGFVIDKKNDSDYDNLGINCIFYLIEMIYH